VVNAPCDRGWDAQSKVATHAARVRPVQTLRSTRADNGAGPVQRCKSLMAKGMAGRLILLVSIRSRWAWRR